MICDACVAVDELATRVHYVGVDSCFDYPNWYEFTPYDREYPKVVGPLFDELDEDDFGE